PVLTLQNGLNGIMTQPLAGAQLANVPARRSANKESVLAFIRDYMRNNHGAFPQRKVISEYFKMHTYCLFNDL
ncbi:MAG TPA: hypothetical protein PLD88_03505, partial [Candidatus Berkiella sp.]|nr:hypothetical protein [Candidatus Berkiella sp.]